MLTIKCKRLFQLATILISVSSFIELTAISSVAAPGKCRFITGEDYDNLHNGHQGILTISDKSNATGNGVSVNIFSGSWRVKSASESQPVTVQTAGSTFLMIRDMGDIKQVWVGTCQSNGFARGNVWDPSVPGTTSSFVMKSR